MGKAKMVGQFKPFLPNSRADMRQARMENEANGIFFPADDPDKW